MLIHPFKDQCIDVDELFDSSTGKHLEFNRFCYNIEKQAAKQSIIDPDKYKGNALELFVEYLLHFYPNDNRLVVSGYTPITTKHPVLDVDGVGISPINGQTVTVLVNYCKSDYLLRANEDYLSNFMHASMKKYDVSPDSTHINIIIITSGAGLHHSAIDDMVDSLVINRDNLRALVDNVEGFWAGFEKAVKEY